MFNIYILNEDNNNLNSFQYKSSNPIFDNEKIRKQNWNEDIINEYHFINHMETNNEINDNWISRYENDEDLSIRIKHLVFNF